MKLLDWSKFMHSCSYPRKSGLPHLNNIANKKAWFMMLIFTSGLLIYLAITRCKKTHKQVSITSSGRNEPPNTAPVYEDIVPTPGREQAGIELKENVAFGPVKK